MNTLLIVDDDRRTLSGLRRHLEDEYRVLTAHNGEEALKVLDEEQNVKVIIADYRMPHINGLDFLLQVQDRYPDLMSIMLTGYPETQLVIDAVNEGKVYQFLTKPCSIERLTEAIGGALQAYEEKVHIQKFRRMESRTHASQELSEREREVLVLMAKGYSNQDISQALTISLGTVKSHIHSIFNKLEVKNRVQAVQKVMSSSDRHENLT